MGDPMKPDGFVWMPYDEKCQVLVDVHQDHVTLTTVVNRGNRVSVTFHMSHDDFVSLAHMMGRLANSMTEDWRWSSDA